MATEDMFIRYINTNKMYANLEIKEEDPLSVTENESQFFTLKTNGGVDNDCNVPVKSEPPYTAFSSLENGECFINHQIKSETVTCSNSCKVEIKTEIDLEQNREDLPGDTFTNVSKHSRDNKIEIKEEPWWLDRQTSSACNDVKDWDFVAVKSSRLCAEAVSADTSEDPLSVSVATSWKDTRFSNGRNCPDCEIQGSSVIKTPSKLSECRICSRALMIKMGQIPHRCKICERSFSSFRNLRRHNLVHKGKKSHKCKICEKSFTRLSSLKSHNLIHEGIKAHKCEICEKRFTDLRDLKRHNLIHEGKRAHKCEICDKGFTQLSNLKRHSLIHESKKPHKCNICEKTFFQLSSLKLHNLMHQGKKPHKCELCEKSFTAFRDFKRHKLIHEGKKPYNCEICEKRFTDVRYLKRHNLIHEAKMAHRCEICDKRFTHLSNLKSHILIHECKNANSLE